MSVRETQHLRVLIANERKDRLALVAPIVMELGHEVIAREIDVADVGIVTARERPDVALVGLGESGGFHLGSRQATFSEGSRSTTRCSMSMFDALRTREMSS